ARWSSKAHTWSGSRRIRSMWWTPWVPATRSAVRSRPESRLVIRCPSRLATPTRPARSPPPWRVRCPPCHDTPTSWNSSIQASGLAEQADCNSDKKPGLRLESRRFPGRLARVTELAADTQNRAEEPFADAAQDSPAVDTDPERAL